MEDHHQLNTLQHLQCIYDDLVNEHKRRSSKIFSILKPGLVTGVYLWGGVGIGKTFLLDCLYNSLPFQAKLRMHFHAFMHFIHKELKIYQGRKNPLKIIAKKISRKYLILFLDEFIVTDIVDAMILARLLKSLFSYGVCLVTTSNIIPDDLYRGGLQRESFLPVISLLKQHIKVIHLTTAKDYRETSLINKNFFFTCGDQNAKNLMQKKFLNLSRNICLDQKTLEIHGRKIPVIKLSANTIWLEFENICGVPRSQQDYLAIASIYKTVFISNLRPIASYDNDRISLLIRMIDVFYDAGIQVFFSSSVEIADIYPDGYMISDFKRTRSRMLEMVANKYSS